MLLTVGTRWWVVAIPIIPGFVVGALMITWVVAYGPSCHPQVILPPVQGPMIGLPVPHPVIGGPR